MKNRAREKPPRRKERILVSGSMSLQPSDGGLVRLQGRLAKSPSFWIKNVDIVNELSLPPVKVHCSVLAEDAIKAALADYKQKQGAALREPELAGSR